MRGHPPALLPTDYYPVRVADAVVRELGVTGRRRRYVLATLEITRGPFLCWRLFHALIPWSPLPDRWRNPLLILGVRPDIISTLTPDTAALLIFDREAFADVRLIEHRAYGGRAANEVLRIKAIPE